MPTPPHVLRAAAIAVALAMMSSSAVATDFGDNDPPDDPRIGLSAGWKDAGTASFGMELVRNVPRPEGFYNPANIGDMALANSDLAFTGDYVVVGNFGGFNIYDISDPAQPELVSSIVCPGGQGDVSVYENLLFMSVEEARGRLDCGPQGAQMPADPERFRGVRVFDITDITAPQQVAAVQTCRGSHTHTVVPDANDANNVYVYVSGASFVRPSEELPGCSRLDPDEDPETSLFRIEVIKVPLAAPHEARVVNQPRIFADDATGEIAGLWPGGDHGDGTQRTAQTNHCHDITVYPELGIAAGACSGNGILIDISDPANPVRIDEVYDTNFAYWHSATFNNDGTSVIFTDEWGGGMGARCRATDPEEWGANAIFTIEGGQMTFASYYKLPVPQTTSENCVAHTGSLVPVPGRDIKVQAWYQGGISVFDFTDPHNPFEIAYFDRGPISEEQLVMGGQWSSYWYNGFVYGSEIARGLDVLRLVPNQHLSQNEIDAANLIGFAELNPQNQPHLDWPAEPVVALAYIDQLERSGSLPLTRVAFLRSQLEQASEGTGAARAQALTRLATVAADLGEAASSARSNGDAIDAARIEALQRTLVQLSQS